MAQTQTFPISEIHKLPYLRRVPDHGRTIPLKPFWEPESGEWHVYFPVSSSELGRLAGGEPVVGSYLSSQAADPQQDREWPLGSFVIQHLSFPEVLPWLDRFEHRYYQLAVAMDKYDLVSGSPTERNRYYMVLAELEYVILIVRSLYDLLQRLIGALARTVHVPGDLERRLIANLPESFAKVVLEGEKERSADAIAARYQLPLPIATFFHREAASFRILRKIRNGIEHHGNAPSEIYQIQAGFAVLVAESPWNELDFWTPEHLRHERFGSLRSVLAHLAKDSLDATTRFAEAFATCVAVPLSLCEDLRVYLRHPSGSWLIRLEEVLAKPWELEPIDDER
jgi:hypothetical protein